MKPWTRYVRRKLTSASNFATTVIHELRLKVSGRSSTRRTRGGTNQFLGHKTENHIVTGFLLVQFYDAKLCPFEVRHRLNPHRYAVRIFPEYVVWNRNRHLRQNQNTRQARWRKSGVYLHLKGTGKSIIHACVVSNLINTNRGVWRQTFVSFEQMQVLTRLPDSSAADSVRQTRRRAVIWRWHGSCRYRVSFLSEA